MKQRLDQALVGKGLVATRSQAESWIKLGKVYVGGQQVTKPGQMVDQDQKLELRTEEKYVSRAGLKLASAAKLLNLDFDKKVVLDVGSSTGGFTDYALQHGTSKVFAVDVGTNQLHASLRQDPRVEFYEQTDIRDVWLQDQAAAGVRIEKVPDIVLVDVSFISVRQVLPHIAILMKSSSLLVVMVKPQFEAQFADLKHRGVIKNDRMRRDILKDFEAWSAQHFVIVDKSDSDVPGSKGNVERFYALKRISK